MKRAGFLVMLFILLIPVCSYADDATVPVYLDVKPQTISFEINESITMSGTAGEENLTVTPLEISNTGDAEISIESVDFKICEESGFHMEEKESSLNDEKAFSFFTEEHDFSQGEWNPQLLIESGGSRAFTFSARISEGISRADERIGELVVTVSGR